MKVLHLGKFETLGGIERHVKTLARGLVATGEVEIVNLVSSDSPRGYEHAEYGYPRSPCPATASSPASRSRHRFRSWPAGFTASIASTSFTCTFPTRWGT